MNIPPDAQRRAELARSLSVVRQRLTDACVRAGRVPGDITLVAVTKGFPASDIDLLAELGVEDIGENRDQEARTKVAVVDAPVRWHFVGQLQTNKARSVARYATAVHSVDRAELAVALGVAATRAERVVDAFVQVSLDADPHRGGMPIDGVPELADTVAETAGLRLAGVMAVVPMHADPAAAFDDLARVAARVRQRHPEAGGMSAGMSADLEPAVAAGTTHVRIGSALLGRRPPALG